MTKSVLFVNVFFQLTGCGSEMHLERTLNACILSSCIAYCTLDIVQII